MEQQNSEITYNLRRADHVNHESNHNITREYRAFTVYYDDTVLAPCWKAMKMTGSVTEKA